MYIVVVLDKMLTYLVITPKVDVKRKSVSSYRRKDLFLGKGFSESGSLCYLDPLGVLQSA